MLRLIGLVLVGVTSFGAMDGAWADWKPSKTVEFARVVQAIVTKYELLGQPAVVVNKGGGSGAEGLVYAKLSAGDPHKIVFATSNEWMLPMVAKLAFRYDDLKPVAAMRSTSSFCGFAPMRRTRMQNPLSRPPRPAI
jgi:putative tricarboxylic transport membrane protein